MTTPSWPINSMMRGAAIAALAIAMLGLTSVAVPTLADKRVAESPVKVQVESRLITHFAPGDESRVRFGKLTFRGGLVLTSKDRDFGGISAMALDEKGERFIAISDHGDWFSGIIRYQGERPAALENVESGPLLAQDGRSLASQKWYDTESLTFDGTTAYIGIERVNQIVRFDASRGFARARGTAIPVPDEIKKLPRNKGLEALVFVPKGMPLGGTLIAFAERGLDAQGNHKAFLIGGPKPGTFTLRREGEFDVSDATLLPGDDILVLERKFSFLSGLGIRLRRVPQSAIAPGALIDGEIIFNADMAFDIDNLEALAVHRSEAGETVLTMMSDDNFSPIQRTILLQFTLSD